MHVVFDAILTVVEELRKDDIIIKNSYEQGLKDAWGCAKKLLFTEPQGGLNYETLKEIFNSDSVSMYSIMSKYSAEEFILKIKRYEEKEKNKVSNDNDIKKTAYWIDTGSGEQCSNCKEIQYGYDNFRNYCAYCGSKMIDIAAAERLKGDNYEN